MKKMPSNRPKLVLTKNSGGSVSVTNCQNCGNKKLSSIIFLGYMQPVNKFLKIDSIPQEEQSFPTQLLFCNVCKLVQLGTIVDPKIIFPKDYPYTSGTTNVLRENFAELSRECASLLNLKKNDLVIDIGSNDGTLLSNFKNNHKVLGITPEDMGKIAIKNGIPTILDYFSISLATKIIKKYGKAKLITAANVFAHMENIHDVVDGIVSMMDKDGVFISESHYLPSLVKTVQYDTTYHEHLRYYSLTSLKYLLEMHGLEIFFAKEIPPHGGSIRVYASKKGTHKVDKKVKEILTAEKKTVSDIKHFSKFKNDVLLSKLKLHSLLYPIKQKGQSIYCIGAPARGSTLVNYVGLDSNIITCILETKGSHKIGKYMPGTLIPVYDEEKLIKDQPEYALFLSWHIANEVIPKLKKKGYKGRFIIPLPIPHIVS